MQTKGLLKSKIVCLAIINLLIALIQFFTGRLAPEGMAEHILGLDWGSLAQALISVAMILARWLFTPRPIAGIL
jgi:hypothetical protein